MKNTDAAHNILIKAQLQFTTVMILFFHIGPP